MTNRELAEEIALALANKDLVRAGVQVTAPVIEQILDKYKVKTGLAETEEKAYRDSPILNINGEWIGRSKTAHKYGTLKRLVQKGMMQYVPSLDSLTLNGWDANQAAVVQKNGNTYGPVWDRYNKEFLL